MLPWAAICPGFTCSKRRRPGALARALLTAGPRFTLRALDADLAVLAARLRIEHRLRLPDAIQLAAALSECCDALVTHDRDFPAGAGVAIHRGDGA